MNLLLDTHIFLWIAEQPQRLAPRVLDALRNPENELFLSVVSIWEIQIKAQIGKLTLPLPVNEFVSIQRAINQLYTLPVFERHIWLLDTLPLYHRDPFDRLLVAQTIAEKYQLVTADPIFDQYPVERFEQ